MKMKILFVMVIILIALGFLASRYYSYIFLPNVSIEENSAVIHIPTGSTIDGLIDTLTARKLLKNKDSFYWVADKMSFGKPKPGRYKISNNWSNKDLVSVLRSGRQEAKKITFNNVRTIEELAEIFGSELEPKTEDFLNYFINDTTLSKYNQSKESMLSIFIPNTYEFYWNTTPEKLLTKLKKENDKFWNDKRLKGIHKIGLTKEEAYTMASIVQKESNSKKEKPIIAGLYLNRIEKGMLLQADPTVIFGVGDFEIRRVLNKHLAYDSPYNTYMYEGLPPGPICMPDISSIDAVVNPEKHDYLYFCVSPGTGFEHAFAKTLKQHNRNAQRYRKWLNSQKIYK